MKLCVFQGTFNPIHKAHLRIAQYVVKKYNFDKILFIPAYKPPHKNYDISYSVHRLNMVELATENNSKFEVSDIEFKREEKSYTYNTICELYDKYEIEGKINFIIGTDAFEKIESWYEADKLKKIIKFIVFIREEDFNPLKYNYLKDKGYDFEFETLSFEDISATNLRIMIKNDQNTEQFLNKKVKDYIEKNALYRT